MLSDFVCTHLGLFLQIAHQIDKFAARGGGARGPSEGRDTSLWNYIPSLNPSIVRVFHLEYSEEAHAELAKCKILSSYLCEDPLTSNANKCILVNREAALYTFAGKYAGTLLQRCAHSLALGIDDPKAIVESLGKPISDNPNRSEIIKALLKNI